MKMNNLYWLQKRNITKIYYILTLSTIALFVPFGLLTGMNIIPSLVGLVLIFPIGYFLYIKENVELSGILLFSFSNIITCAIAIYFGGLKSNTIYFIPVIFSFGIYILPPGKSFAVITLLTTLFHLILLSATQGTGYNQYFFTENEFFRVMLFTILLSLLILVILNYRFNALLVSVSDKLVEEKEKSQRLTKEKKKLLSILFHDLANNLTASYHRLHPDKVLLIDDEKNKRDFDTGFKNLKMMKELLDHVRELEKQNNIKSFEINNVNLESIVSESLSTFDHTLLEKGITVTTKLNIKEVLTNKHGLQFNILNNLLSNAIKFTPEGGEIRVCSEGSKDSFTLTVSNPGAPIQKHIKSDLFKIDKQATTLGTNGERGNGFGLAIAKDVAEKLNGEIVLDDLNGEIKFSFKC